MTVMGDAPMERLSDAGSIPARSIFLNRENPVKSGDSRFFYNQIHLEISLTV